MSRVGWWADHEYSRRSIGEVESFCGWSQLNYIVGKAEESRVKALLSALFLTGCRASELLTLRREQVEVDTEFVRVHDAPVEKSHRGSISIVEGWEKDPRTPKRNFAFPAKEPLVPYLVKQVDDTAPGERIFPRSYSWLYQKVRAVDPDWLFPHRLRSERASCLVTNYGFDTVWLMRWFGWRQELEVGKYAKLSTTDFEAKMAAAKPRWQI